MKPKPEDKHPFVMGVAWGGLVAAMLLSPPVQAETADAEGRACCSLLQTDKSPSQPQRLSEPAARITRRYACDLRAVFNQCRQYTLEEGAAENIARLAQGCASMGGSFGKQTCSASGVSGICRDIVPDYRKPDVVYDNYYYKDASRRWSTSVIQHACTTLEGEYSKPE